MNRKSLISALVFVLACFICTTALFAEESPTVSPQTGSSQVIKQKTGSEGRTGKPERRKGGPLMRVLDADRDGVLSAAEIGNATNAIKALDKNGDGNVTRDELPRKEEKQDSRGGNSGKTENQEDTD